MSKQYRVKSPPVMHETIEDEVILINLETGSYYSLRATGAEIWRGVEQGVEEARIVEALAQGYDASGEEVGSAVAGLLQELEKENLIEVSESGDDDARLMVAAAAERRFRAPVLEKHTDMQDLILLDPVHEVDPRGWPHAAPADLDQPPTSG